MRTLEELRALWAEAPPPSPGRGTVRHIVIRPVSGERQTPRTAQISPERGVHGDRWSQAEAPDPDAQVTLMDIRVADVVGRAGEHALFGDNFLVDLDLGEDALPVGARLRIGSALIEVTAKPHTGCDKYRERFGVDALRWVNHKSNRRQRLRGLHCRVLRAGTVEVGDPIEIESDR